MFTVPTLALVRRSARLIQRPQAAAALEMTALCCSQGPLKSIRIFEQLLSVVGEVDILFHPAVPHGPERPQTTRSVRTEHAHSQLLWPPARLYGRFLSHVH